MSFSHCTDADDPASKEGSRSADVLATTKSMKSKQVFAEKLIDHFSIGGTAMRDTPDSAKETFRHKWTMTQDGM